MPLYEFMCRTCGNRDTTMEQLQTLGECPECGVGEMKRKYSFAQKPMMQEHFNHTVGKRISDMKQFKDELKRGDEHYHSYTGIERRSAPIDFRDVKVTSEGLDSTNRERAKRGLPPVTV